MFIKEYLIDNWYMRRSKLGKQHTYNRKKRMVLMECDNCHEEFSRPRGNMDPKRISNNYFHVCENCDSKIFAQNKGVENRKIWKADASSNLKI